MTLKSSVNFNRRFLFGFIVLISPNYQKVFSNITPSYSYDWLLEAYSKHPKYWPKPSIDPSVNWQELGILKINNQELNPTQQIYTNLGKKLFFDPRISANKTISCASCHRPDSGWADNKRLSIGHNELKSKRNTPSIANLSEFNSFFWDGRAKSIQKQILSPLTNPREMNISLKELTKRVNELKEYRKKFEQITNRESVSVNDITLAIASYERTIKTKPSRFDKFLAKKISLNEDEIRGLHLFRTKARCMNCHHGTYFTDNKFHNIGLTYYGRKFQDLGRYEITKNPEDVGRFKTPSLRNVMNTGPWMHNGLFRDMNGILNMYSFGGERTSRKISKSSHDPLYPKKSYLLKPFSISKEERKSIIAFLNAISTE